ncbi:MAG: aminoacyl-tRNA hydrolase [Candidatus Azobacteroides pseudotrichonymphae]|jgi:PTH1 family peptidyl-tRNA hydrolase|uniref:Peptidyl-tRNA hydrolase n=1 Tax=Azobacteroides pseudotrichonymphae genomovar. CFP2 TaxID=511995 RepID=PTH_AZOPC|nr:aminoacyl-tRNA hydrolase [Candidatus Azobacteroides pseudotrichonymphae]B6YQC2.1 RecName: Full=Peptidyl-tRNA hydrolase; Short=PTH [Candidatus Azobacteroides pseudotrichonymphae genomovar. CFP2]MDR0530306.1 aminoacyl-tRNA hydrolase [Bacteroidales bacterium OttesenSCG-928-I14]BAG83394.1 peptidyl-tRNA hydrolase [Candidatus Azobacteroides pseudotrichonymphae genomovar. CFP2]GMO35751.1 MAG: aminoacyl-tRNA hydrolase [Candidatus Azobacteroides pseudotrichonymphae]
MKYLVAGLGNVGQKYENSRHNIGFMILDALAKASSVVFTDKCYGAIASLKLKNKCLFLLKPSTYMNLSGNAIRYWLQKENIYSENLLILVDDLSLPFGSLRLKTKGSDGGHNGLKNIQYTLRTKYYNRLRFGIGNNFPSGCQINYVLDNFTKEEKKHLSERIEKAIEIVYSFCLSGSEITMNLFNK